MRRPLFSSPAMERDQPALAQSHAPVHARPALTWLIGRGRRGGRACCPVQGRGAQRSFGEPARSIGALVLPKHFLSPVPLPLTRRRRPLCLPGHTTRGAELECRLARPPGAGKPRLVPQGLRRRSLEACAAPAARLQSSFSHSPLRAPHLLPTTRPSSAGAATSAASTRKKKKKLSMFAPRFLYESAAAAVAPAAAPTSFTRSFTAASPAEKPAAPAFGFPLAAAAALTAAAPTEKVELYSPKFYQVCAVGGALCCGGTHTAVTPLDVVKCNMQVWSGVGKGVGGGEGRGACACARLYGGGQRRRVREGGSGRGLSQRSFSLSLQARARARVWARATRPETFFLLTLLPSPLALPLSLSAPSPDQPGQVPLHRRRLLHHRRGGRHARAGARVGADPVWVLDSGGGQVWAVRCVSFLFLK